MLLSSVSFTPEHRFKVKLKSELIEGKIGINYPGHSVIHFGDDPEIVSKK